MHQHDHNEKNCEKTCEKTCGCGGHHHHEHVHDEHCGCGHNHTPIAAPDGLSPMQADFLMAIHQRSCLPIACFTFAKADDAGRHAVALSPVYMSSPADSMEQVKTVGNELIQLEDMGLLTLDYDIPLKGYAYNEYKNSELYAYFAATVKEAAALPNTAFDTARLDLGSMALTEAGEAMVEKMVS